MNWTARNIIFQHSRIHNWHARPHPKDSFKFLLFPASLRLYISGKHFDFFGSNIPIKVNRIEYKQSLSQATKPAMMTDENIQVP